MPRERINTRINKPQASTFRATNVVHVGAQRRESEASNYQRLANDLGAFNSALRSASGALSARWEKEAKREADYVEAVGNADPDLRHQRHVITGDDGVVTKFKSIAEVNNRLLPEMAAAEDNLLQEYGEKEWQVETGQVTTEVGPDGEPIETPVLRTLTPEDLLERRQQINAEILERYPNPADAPIVEKLFNFTAKAYSKQIGALNDFTVRKRNRDADEVIQKESSSMALALASDSGNPDEMAERLISNAARISKEMNASEDKDFITSSVFKGISLNIEGNLPLARAAVKLVQGSPADGISNYLKHPKYTTDANRILKLAKNEIASAEAGTLLEAKVLDSVKRMAEGESFAELELEDEKIEGGTKSFTVKAKDVEEAIAKRRDAAILTVNGVKQEIPEIHQLELLAMGTAKSGILSPTLKTTLEDFAISPDAASDKSGRYDRSLAAYRAIQNHDPLNLSKYIKDGNKRKALRQINLLTEVKGLRPQEAAQYIYERLDGAPSILPEHRSTIKRFRKGAQTLSSQEKDEVEETFDILYGDDRDMTRSDARERLEELQADLEKGLPKVHGSTIKVPENKNPDVWVDAVTKFTDKVAEEFGIDLKSVRLKESSNGYYLMDKASGLPVLQNHGPDRGQRIYLKESAIESNYEAWQESEAENRESKAYNAVKNKYGPGYNSLTRRALKPDELKNQETQRRLRALRTERYNFDVIAP
jgi:hypothetical protein